MCLANASQLHLNPTKETQFHFLFTLKKGNLQFINMEGGNVAMLTNIFIICKA